MLFLLLWLCVLILLALWVGRAYFHNKSLLSERSFRPTQPDKTQDTDTIERYPSQEEIDLKKDLEKENIIGFAKPIGFWTTKILAEKFQVLMERLTHEEGYWQRFVQQQETQERTEQKHHFRQHHRSKSRR